MFPALKNAILNTLASEIFAVNTLRFPDKPLLYGQNSYTIVKDRTSALQCYITCPHLDVLNTAISKCYSRGCTIVKFRDL